MTVNKAILIGNLGADPEVRHTASGSIVANLRLATTDRRKDKDGNWNDFTEWHSVVVFGKTAENVGRFCRKGKALFIEGRIQTRKWQDRDGKDRWSTEVVANDVRFLGGKSDGGGSGSSGGYGGSQGGSSQSGGGNTYGGSQGQGQQGQPYGNDEDVPF